jgi:hypothetical protein
LASDDVVALAVGLALGLADAFADGLADAAAGLAVSDDAAVAVGDGTTATGVGVDDATLTASGVERRPAIARPTARITTTA